MKENFAGILIYSNDPYLLDKQTDLIKHENENFIISASSDKKDFLEQIKNNKHDLIVFNMDGKFSKNIDMLNEILNNNIYKDLFFLFTIEAKDLESLLKKDIDLLRIDYLINPVQDKIFTHKISLLVQNITQKKATEYLVDAYDQNVIASKTDKKGIITYSSKAFCDICEYKEEELIGRSHNIVRHPDMPKKIYKELWETIKKGEIWRGELKNLTKSGGYYWVDVIISPDFDYKGDIIGYTSIRHDITSKKYIEQITITDHLTKLYNKKFFEESLEKELYTAKRYNYPLNLILLDIDHFKKINDTYGHATGDLVLKDFAKILKNNSRKSDIISRVGGEEFAIIVTNDNKQSVSRFADKLKTLIENHNFEKVHKVTASIGLCQLSKDDTENSFFEKCDIALYNAKKSGRNQVKIY